MAPRPSASPVPPIERTLAFGFKRRRTHGFTLVELLVVCAIIGVLLYLLLPAIQAARESARIAHCRNNLREISTGVMHHEQSLGRFPVGGWGHEWVGMAGRGFGPEQPGGWIYNTLPFIEQKALRDRFVNDSTPGEAPWLATPLSLFNCPTRRSCQARQVSDLYPYMLAPKPASIAHLVGRGDYAMNCGATLAASFPGPPDLATGDSGKMNWPITSGVTTNPEFEMSGISHVRTGIAAKQILDGLSNTYLVGEKFIDSDHYEDGEFLGDNESLFSGFCTDNHRFTKLNMPPMQDAPAGADVYAQLRFGSAHAIGALFAFCDGTVRMVTFDVDDEVHYRSGCIADLGKPLPASP